MIPSSLTEALLKLTGLKSTRFSSYQIITINQNRRSPKQYQGLHKIIMMSDSNYHIR